MNPLDKLLKVINTENIVSEKDVEEVLLGVAGLLKQYKENTEKYTEEKVLEISQGINDFYQFLSEFKADITSENRHVENSIKDQLSEVLKETKSVKKLFDKKYKELLSLELKDGKDADEEKIVEDVLNKIKLPEYKEVVLDNGESIIDKINAVEGEDAPKIDASHIKNLPQTVQQFTGSKLLSTLGDVNIQNPTNGQVIKYDFVARQWYNGSDATGGGAGGGASAYTDLTDATTVNLPTLNTPLQAALAAKATPADISNAISALVDTAPGTLDTLNELAAALGDDPNFATTITSALAGKAPTSHTHTAAQITDFNTAVSANSDVTSNTAARHAHSNKALLDTYTQTETNLADAVAKKHTHANQAVLDSTTASYTTAEQSKLAGIAAGAEVNVNADWNAVSGDAQILNKPTTFTPSAHTHTIADTTGLQTALDGKATTSHTHTINDLSDVVVTSPTAGQVIKFDGTNWINDADSVSGGGGGVTDHGALTGLGDDDHTQYHNDARGDARYYTKSEVDTSLSGKVTSNIAITGATKTKITYDAKGLVTAGGDATTADIADSTNKRYVTDAQLTVIGNTSNTNTGDETTATIKSKLGITTLSGSNTGDQTSIVGITGTTAQFNTALTDNDFATLAGTETLTNKKIVRRVSSTTSTATLTPTYGTYDDYQLTAQAAALTIANPTGTPSDGEQFIIRVKDNATARAITFGTAYRAIGVTLPTTTTISKTVYIGCKYNATDTKVDVIALAQEA